MLRINEGILSKYGINNLIVMKIKTGFGMTLEFLNRGFQPDWFSQIKLIADFIKGVKDFVCACVIAFIADDSIP